MLHASFRCGGTGIYFGKVAHDTNGEFYKQDLQQAGVDFPVPLAPATSMILSTK